MPIYRFSLRLSFYMLIGIALSACFTNTQNEDKALKSQFKNIDSILVTGKKDSAIALMVKLRPRIKATDPLISNYYCNLSEYSRNEPPKMELYADSAIAFFVNEENIKQHPNEYLKALLLKGDANFLKKRYDIALEYYYKAKKQLLIAGCDNGDLANKLVVLYYKQKNYRLAARYSVQEYKLADNCAGTMTAQQSFFVKQAALDNAGYTYQMAGILDSATFYLNLDLSYIDQAAKSKLVDEINIEPARFVLYDNLIGVNLEKGNLTLAEKYVNECFNLPYNDQDGRRTTAFIKMADLYLRTGRYALADSAFKKSRRLLDRFPKDNYEAEIRWNKLYAAYLFKLQKPVEAYIYQGNYIRLKDSVDRSWSTIYQLNIENEIGTLQQQQAIIDLKHQDSVKLFYLTGLTIAAILSVIIIFLINRNLKQSRKNYRITTLQNEQLQTTLAELERANKNYIRIMRVMAHDLRNPLSGMIGLATVLLDEDEFSEDSKHMLQLIETTGIHSIEMINELLKSGLADENEVVEKQTLDLKALLQDSVELLQFKANEKKQRIEFLADDGPIMVAFNHEKIWRVFNNLIVNAIKFSYEGSIIKSEIRLLKDKHKVIVSIADSGIGIPDKDKDSIFEMFTPAKKTGTNGEQPFGLGLSISKKIIEKHNGKIWFESIAGTGTTFYIELPVN